MDLVLIKNDPRQKCIDDCQARIDERRGRSVRFEVIRPNNPSAAQRKSQPADDADHPGWKIRTENVDRRRTVTHRSSHEDQYPDQQDESCKRDVSGPTAPSGWKIRNNSRKFRFSSSWLPNEWRCRAGQIHPRSTRAPPDWCKLLTTCRG